MQKPDVSKDVLGSFLPAYVLASLVCFFVMPSLFGQDRNPPWRLYGGLNLEAQTFGFCFSVVNIIVSAVFIRLRTDRRLSMVALTALWSGVAFAFLAWYWMSLSFPSV